MLYVQNSHTASVKKNKEQILLLSIFTSTLGSGIAIITSALLISNKTGNPEDIGLLFIAAAFPQAFMSFFSGLLSRRLTPKKICFITSIVCSVVSLWLFSIVLFGNDTPALLYTFSFIISSCSALCFPAINMLIRYCINEGDLPRFNARFEVALQIGSLISVALGGIALDIFPAAYIFLFSTCTYLLSGLLITQIKYINETTNTKNNQGERVVKTYRSAGALLLYATGSVIITVTNMLMVIIVVQYFGASATSLGIADALAGIGVIFSALITPYLNKAFKLPLIICGGFLISAFFILIQPRFELNHYFFLFPLGCLFYGFARIGCRQLIYSLCTQQMTGRFFGVANAIGLVLSVPITLGISEVVKQHGIIAGYTYTASYIVVSTCISMVILNISFQRIMQSGLSLIKTK